MTEGWGGPSTESHWGEEGWQEHTEEPNGENGMAKKYILPGITSFPLPGEDVCEYKNYDRSNKTLCLRLGCCQFDQRDRLCYSNVYDGPCIRTSAMKSNLKSYTFLVNFDYR